MHTNLQLLTNSIKREDFHVKSTSRSTTCLMFLCSNDLISLTVTVDFTTTSSALINKSILQKKKRKIVKKTRCVVINTSSLVINTSKNRYIIEEWGQKYSKFFDLILHRTSTGIPWTPQITAKHLKDSRIPKEDQKALRNTSEDREKVADSKEYYTTKHWNNSTSMAWKYFTPLQTKQTWSQAVARIADRTAAYQTI